MGMTRHKALWRGIAISIGYDPGLFGEGRAHFDIAVPDGRPISLTSTGYRSHFTSVDDVEAAGGAVEYTLALLDIAAAHGTDAAMRWRPAQATVAADRSSRSRPTEVIEEADVEQLCLFR